ncbi:MAG: hypothetical protein WBF35_05095 [Candidatus Acidiferrales bacterium]
MSSAMVNVLWGSLNLAIGYFLVWRVGMFDLRSTHDMVVAGIGGLAMGMLLARTFSQVKLDA